MNCTRFRLLLRTSELLPPSPAGRLRSRLAPHAFGCPGCRSYQSRLTRMPGLLRAAYECEIAEYLPPNSPEWRVLPLRGYPPPPRLALVLACLVGVLLGGAAWLGRPRAAGPLLTGAPATVSGGGPTGRPATEASSALPGRSAEPAITGPTAGIGSDPGASWLPFPRESAPETPPASSPDSEYLNGQEPDWVASWLASGSTGPNLSRLIFQMLPPVRDDFVRVPLPMLADSGGGALAARTLAAYEKEAAVADARLFQKVSLELKGGSLDQLCAELTRQTGVRMHAARGLGDEKVTVLLEEKPARDVMRAVARLFGYFWSRAGEPGDYRYTLEQGLKAQLAEEEMRSEDLNSALLSLDAAMAADAPLLGLSLEQLRQRAAGAAGAERAHLKALAGGGWGGLQVYHRLSPAERSELHREGRLAFSMENPNPERRLPPEWKQTLLDSCRVPTLQEDGTFQADSDRPDAQPVVVLSIDRSEAGQLTLHSDTYAHVPGEGGTSIPQVLAVGKSASTEDPGNAARSARLRSRPELQRKVALRPEPSCPYLKDPSRNDPHELGMTYGTHYFGVLPELPRPHLNSADVWLEVHKRTGLPVVADFYSRLYPAAPFTTEAAPAFDALCRAADHLGARWSLDGGFVLGRSTAFFWDKLKEVPGRYLDQWAQDAKANAGLPLEDLVQMASCTPPQLDSTRTGGYIRHCVGLEEWLTVGGGDANSSNGWRGRVQALAALSPAQLQAAQSGGGIDLGGLAPAQQEALRQTMNGLTSLKELAGVRFRIDYVPAGWYVWQPVVSREEAGPLVEMLFKQRVVAARTREGALEAGRKLRPSSGPGDVRRCTGLVSFTVTLPDGRLLTEGRPSALIPGP